MSLKSRMLLLAILPLVLVTSAITLLSLNQARQLSEQDIAAFEEKLLAAKRSELKNYVELALTSIDHLVSQPDPDPHRIRQILRALTYGSDGYFFVYSQDGTNLVHPRQLSLEGRNLIDFQDRNGNYVIRDLLRVARDGGYHRYLWSKPSKGDLEDKMSYVVTLPQLDWMLGTGLYLDDIYAEVSAARAKTEQNIRSTFFTVLIVLTSAIFVVVLAVVLINVRLTVQADERIRELAKRYIQWQIGQRYRFARELKEDVAPLLELSHVALQRQVGILPVQHLQTASLPLQKALLRLDEISQQLRPSPLDELGLQGALKQLAESASERSGIHVRTRLKLPDQPVPDEIANTLYTLAEEALANSEQHSDASQIALQLWEDKRRIHLEVEDNGKGFYTDVSGPGLARMRERTELLSGSFELLSKPGQGTLIRAILPGYLNDEDN